MKLIDTIRRAGRSLRQAKARTLLTSLAIAVGAFTLTAAMAVGEGARQYGEKLIGDNINPQVLFIVADKELFTGQAQQASLRVYDPNVGMTSAGATLKMLTQKQVDSLKARSDLEKVVPTYDLSVRYVTFQGSDIKFTADIAAYVADGYAVPDHSGTGHDDYHPSRSQLFPYGFSGDSWSVQSTDRC